MLETHRDGTHSGIARGTISVALGIAVANSTTAVGFLVLARFTDAPQLGSFGAAYAFSTFAASIMDFGSSQAATRRMAAARDLAGFWAWWSRRTALSVVALPLVWAAIHNLWGKHLSALTSGMLSLQAVTLVAALGSLSVVRSLRSPVVASWLTAAGNVLFLVMCINPFGSRLDSAAIGAAASWLLTCIAALACVPRHLGSGQRPKRRNPWSGASGFGVLSLSLNAQLLVVPIVSVLATVTAAGELAAVNRWVQPIMLIPLAYSTLMFPQFARRESFREVDLDLRRGRRLLVLSGVAVLLTVVLAPIAVPALVGQRYRSAVPVLQWLAIAVTPSLVGQPLAIALQARGDGRRVATVGIASAIVTIGVTAAVASSFGASSGPLAIGLGNLTFAVLLARRFARQAQHELRGHSADQSTT